MKAPGTIKLNKVEYMNESNKPTQEEQNPLMGKLMELSGRIISMQNDSRRKEVLEEIIKYLKIIKRDMIVYFAFTYFLLFILLYHEYLKKFLSIIF